MENNENREKRQEEQGNAKFSLQDIKEIGGLLIQASKEWKALEIKATVDNRGEIMADLRVTFDAEKDEVMTIQEAADYLKVAEQSIYNLLKSGALKAFKVGRAGRIMKSELEGFIEEQSNGK